MSTAPSWRDPLASIALYVLSGPMLAVTDIPDGDIVASHAVPQAVQPLGTARTGYAGE